MKEASPNGWLDNGRIETKAVLYLMTIRALRNTEYVTHAQSRNLVRRNERISPSAERKLKWRREVDWAKTEMRREATTRLRPDWHYDSTVFETSKNTDQRLGYRLEQEMADGLSLKPDHIGWRFEVMQISSFLASVSKDSGLHGWRFIGWFIGFSVDNRPVE